MTAVVTVGTLVGGGMVMKEQISVLQEKVKSLETARTADLERGELPALKAEVAGLRKDLGDFRDEWKRSQRRTREDGR